MLGRQPFRIDLLNQIDGISVPFISLDDDVANKRAAGRKKDAYDLGALGFESET